MTMSPDRIIATIFSVVIFTCLQRKALGDCNRLGNVRGITFNACGETDRRRRSYRTILFDFSALSNISDRNIQNCNCSITTNRTNILNVFETNLPEVRNCGTEVTFINPVNGRTYRSTCNARANFSSLMIRDSATLSLHNVDGNIRSSDYCIRVEGSIRFSVECSLRILSSGASPTPILPVSPVTKTDAAISVTAIQSASQSQTVLVLASLLGVSLLTIFGLSATIAYLISRQSRSRSSMLTRYEVSTFPDPSVQYDTLQKNTLEPEYTEITA